jgi:hypothetical protein
MCSRHTHSPKTVSSPPFQHANLASVPRSQLHPVSTTLVSPPVAPASSHHGPKQTLVPIRRRHCHRQHDCSFGRCLHVWCRSERPPLWGFLDVPRSVVVKIAMGLLLYSLVKPAVMRWWRNGEEKSVYGLQHGRLHVQLPTAMWMNMGYWKEKDGKGEGEMMLAEACRDLLKVVLAEAGFGSERRGDEGEDA